MSLALPCSLLTITVDAEMDTTRRGLDQQGQLEAVTANLLALLAEYRLPATWAVADPAISAATDRIIAEAGGHELAILGDRTWVGNAAGRNRFGNELQRRVTHGRAAGLDIGTLVLRDVQLDDHSDLVVKLELKSVVVPNVWNRRLRISPAIPLPEQIRFGLWELPVTIGLPGSNRWLPGGGGRLKALRMIDRANRQNLPVQILLNCLDLAVRPASFGVLESLLGKIARLHQSAKLQVVTQAVLAERLTGDRQMAPAHSILRPAA
jgi:hypothetical protein